MYIYYCNKKEETLLAWRRDDLLRSLYLYYAAKPKVKRGSEGRRASRQAQESREPAIAGSRSMA